ncbi:hypothetical protein L596_016389 [Steinernema carpocapsae]|uniref:Uncharacterized protein n=1 Tax=Steinernema carpocapsae TaxID=34508 RepID=A0A4U5NIG1_STECR|nr:hypothetical protein L596_016389 [Steinernema carpocapsae]
MALPNKKEVNCGYGNVTQLVDHFNSSNKDTWQQRYQFNMQYYKKGSGLVFFMLGRALSTERARSGLSTRTSPSSLGPQSTEQRSSKPSIDSLELAGPHR